MVRNFSVCRTLADIITQSYSESHSQHISLVAKKSDWLTRENTEEASEEGTFVRTLPHFVSCGPELLGVSSKMQK